MEVAACVTVALEADLVGQGAAGHLVALGYAVGAVFGEGN